MDSTKYPQNTEMMQFIVSFILRKQRQFLDINEKKVPQNKSKINTTNTEKDLQLLYL